MARELPGVFKGVIVGLANTVVVAICICAISPGLSLAPFVLIVMYGCVPGMMTGALLGHLAFALSHVNRHLVLAGMIVVSCLAVASLGDMFGMQELVFASCLPTAAACSVLERWTRPKPVERLPLARVA